MQNAWNRPEAGQREQGSVGHDIRHQYYKRRSASHPVLQGSSCSVQPGCHKWLSAAVHSCRTAPTSGSCQPKRVGRAALARQGRGLWRGGSAACLHASCHSHIPRWWPLVQALHLRADLTDVLKRDVVQLPPWRVLRQRDLVHPTFTPHQRLRCIRALQDLCNMAKRIMYVTCVSRVVTGLYL
jgi:hypothetical protein